MSVRGGSRNLGGGAAALHPPAPPQGFPWAGAGVGELDVDSTNTSVSSAAAHRDAYTYMWQREVVSDADLALRLQEEEVAEQQRRRRHVADEQQNLQDAQNLLLREQQMPLHPPIPPPDEFSDEGSPAAFETQDFRDEAMARDSMTDAEFEAWLRQQASETHQRPAVAAEAVADVRVSLPHTSHEPVEAAQPTGPPVWLPQSQQHAGAVGTASDDGTFSVVAPALSDSQFAAWLELQQQRDLQQEAPQQGVGMQETAADTRHVASVPGVPPATGAGAGAAPGAMTDEELAAWLQEQDEAEAMDPLQRESLPQPAPGSQQNTGNRSAGLGEADSSRGAAAESQQQDQSQELSDEAFARLLQEQEDAAAAQPEPEAGTGSANRGRPDAARSSGSSWPDMNWRNLPFADQAHKCLPMMASICGGDIGGGGGALVGCFTGLQLGDCVGCSSAVTWICALAGALFGSYSSTNRHGRPGVPSMDWLRAGGRSGGRENDWYPDSSDEDEPEQQHRGLDPTTIDSHTIGHVYGEASSSAAPVPGESDAATGENRQCMICMEAFASGDVLRTLPCLHRYHQNCADEWLRRSRECPICKRDITEVFLPPAEVPAPRRGGTTLTARLRNTAAGETAARASNAMRSLLRRGSRRR
eukprot:TRINITY_DN47015_c0_g1_i1.p1 TRINITY_DN47015_c0_g1~~TRINITY_DN47015_c0_g1_i1.p1  ORF type:complete len:643 (+),score=124.16 TRINITY_DN47015_c0_g1_i1:81-2009(+)